jgi:hypothetical protein
MSFTGKATYTAGTTLPEIAEDVSDLVGINSPHETPLLDALGDPPRSARSTVHEWLEDALLPNTDTVNDSTYGNATTDTSFVVDNGSRFRVGDQIRTEGSAEVMLVTAVNTGRTRSPSTAAMAGARPRRWRTTWSSTSSATQHSKATTPSAPLHRPLAQDQLHADLLRHRRGQRLGAGREAAWRGDELDYQKHQRTRELLRDLENCVINGRAPRGQPEGSATVRRTMRGILPSSRPTCSSRWSRLPRRHIAHRGAAQPRAARHLGRQQRERRPDRRRRRTRSARSTRSSRATAASRRRPTPFRDHVAVYESDFGVCRVVLSRWVRPGHVLLLDSSRIDVMPLTGRSFHYKPLATTGDRESGQVVGEYTLELRNENAHGVIKGLG